MTDEKSIDLQGITDRLPHRYPFLLVDRVRSVIAGKSIVALKNVSANEGFFQGHFPQYAVMPGVLVIEALAQAAGVLAYETASEQERLWLLYLVGVDNARFKLPVKPGDQLVLNVELVQRRRNLWRFACRAEVDGRVVAETDLLLAEGPKP
ncbi:MAG TPA: 3-hydroxyacyl-ACP dehydratase FabZ [Gammaproteobacteria bacterium]|nr:3-hydroxyacyl-ACP dehydratase FabZ [Gammaproteobacteria bacterium]